MTELFWTVDLSHLSGSSVESLLKKSQRHIDDQCHLYTNRTVNGCLLDLA